MKLAALLDHASAEVLGFEWLAAAVAPVSAYGERAFSELRPFLPGEELAAGARAENVARFASHVDPDRREALRAALRESPDVAGAIARAAMGEVLGDASFLELLRFCETIDRIDASMPQPRPSFGNEGVGAVAEALAAGRSENGGFYLSDAFSADLGRARAHLAREQARLDAARGREIEAAARELGRDELPGDEFIVMRADLRDSLPEGVRVVREAPTYLLCELEYGESSMAALRRREEAAEAVAELEERVRERLSGIVREHAAALESSAEALGGLDVLLGAARFADRYDCVAADVSLEPVLTFARARFLPIEEELLTAGRRFVPLDLELRDAAVLTGPNMGGKTVALQTCGLVALCAAFGLPVPAARASVGLFDHIAWLGIGRDERAGGLLSSFAREVVELKEILSRDAPRLLLLADEFARTTTPHEGRALLIALLARMRERGACAMLATHLEGIAAAAGVRHFAVRGLRGVLKRPPAEDVAEALAVLAESMDYSIAEVSPADVSRADAIALTALLGVDQAFVDGAYSALTQ